MTGPSSPRVRFPPPIVYLGAWYLGWQLDKWRGFPVDAAGASTFQLAFGVASTIAGAALTAWALATLARFRTPIAPWQAATRLVVAGPFVRSRNPAYTGLALVYVGVAALANLAWPIVTLPVALIVLAIFVIAPEERHLRATFGAEYDQYARRTPRWL